MTTSYKLEAIKELKAQKKLEREAEANALVAKRQEEEKARQASEARIAAKLARIASGEPAPAPEPVVEKVAPVVEKTPVKKTSDVSLESMSKKELESYGRTLGVELDRRHSRKDLVKELKEVL